MTTNAINPRNMQDKRRKRKPFWKDIKFKYKITISNENTLEEVAGLRVSKLNGISILVFTLTLLFVLASLLIAFTPLRNYLPGYMNSEIRAQVVNNALRADSLQAVLERQQLYIMNIQDIFQGKIKADTVPSLDSLVNMQEDSLMEPTARELAFRQQYEETEKYNLTTIASRSEADGLLFYKPVTGLPVKPFDTALRHYGTDIALADGESILSVLDGTVLMSAFVAGDGYVLVVQHNQDFVSVYKHCGTLLKHEGDAVKGGEAIAVAAGGEEDGRVGHLHFELWRKGRPVNPEQYIVY